MYIDVAKIRNKIESCIICMLIFTNGMQKHKSDTHEKWYSKKCLHVSQTPCTKAIAEICPFTLPSIPVTCIIKYDGAGAASREGEYN